MFFSKHSFIAWEEHIICQERGSRVVHYFLKDDSGDSVLAVIGTERSIRHMIYVISDGFLQAYGSVISVTACTKWRSRREVVEWLTFLVSRHPGPSHHIDSQRNYLTEGLGSFKFATAGVSSPEGPLPDQMVTRKLKAQSSDIVWSGVAWTCAKQLDHYPAFCRNNTAIAVHSFVFIMSEEESRYLAYLEDLYEDKKGHKKVKVRWFHHNQEVKGILSRLNPHPKEVLITPHVQVISAECIDGPATVLTPKHFEKCLAAVPYSVSSLVYMCFRQLKNDKLKPFTLSKLCGYFDQAIFTFLNGPIFPKEKVNCLKLHNQEVEEFAPSNPLGKRHRNDFELLRYGTSPIRNSAPGSHKLRYERIYPKLKFRLSKKAMGIEVVNPQIQCHDSFKVDDKIELLCQDSGIRGCWFRCKVLQTSQQELKVIYDDVRDADEFGNLEEWIPASRVAAPDKLGMRCSGRLTIRPRPAENVEHCFCEVGAPVDAWWNDGWWEGVITEVDVCGTESLQVYFPGEDMFQTIQKKDTRTSRDWVGNRWIDIKSKHDILRHIFTTLNSSTKLTRSTSVDEMPSQYGVCISPTNCDVRTAPRLEAVQEVEEDEQDLCCMDALDDFLGNEINLGNQSCPSGEYEDAKCTNGIVAREERESVFGECFVSVNQKYIAAEVEC